jgi:hypothetical protein
LNGKSLLWNAMPETQGILSDKPLLTGYGLRDKFVISYSELLCTMFYHPLYDCKRLSFCTEFFFNRGGPEGPGDFIILQRC